MSTGLMTSTKSVTEIAELIIELLADLLKEETGTLRDQMLTGGSRMPVDSLDMFDILQEFRNRTGIALPVRKLKRDTLRSVQSFAEFVADLENS